MRARENKGMERGGDGRAQAGGEVKIYIASSWKNAEMAFSTAIYLRKRNFVVDVFCDNTTGRYVFHWSEMLISPDKSISKLNAITFLEDKRSQRAFKEDKKWLDWCDACVLVLPAGNSAHLEAGYIKGQSKELIIYAPLGFPQGEFDVMYGFADLMTDEIEKVIKELKDSQEEEK